MKQKLQQIAEILARLSGFPVSRTVSVPLFLFDCRKVVQNNPAAYRYIRLLLCAVLLTGAPAMAQTITGNTPVCVGSSITLGFSGNSGGTWSSSNTGIAIVDPGSGTVTGVAAGTATVTYIVTGVPVTATVTVNSLLDAGTISGPNAVCIGTTITLANSMPGGTWSADNGVLSVGSTTGIVTGNALGSGNIIYTVTNSCGAASSQVNIMVNGLIGDMYTFAGTGTSGFSGDGGPAFNATMADPRDLFVEPTTGTLYVCDPGNNRIRKITRAGIITTVAGNGGAGNTGDGGQATAASLNAANGVFVDNAGNIFISNSGSATIRKINTSGIISTIAGTGAFGSTGDGGPATAATISFPLGILEDASGNIYIADNANNNIRKVTAATGIITTVVGSTSGTSGYSGDGGPATAALLNGVRGLTMDNSGNIYIADATNNVIRKYVPATGIITTIAGTGAGGHAGDGGPATAATLTTPARFAYDGANILYLSDQSNNVIREINLATGIISEVAGNYSTTGAYSGDQGNALTAQLNTPAGIAGDHFGNFYIADALNNRVRVVPSTGSLSASIVGPNTVCAGTPVSFTAFLSSSGSPAYQWQKNGVNIGSGGAAFTDPSPSDSDVYRCIVTVTPVCSAAFNDTSNNIPVFVKHAASTITAPATIYAGQSAQLGETVPGGSWSSSATTIATVDTNGVLYAVAAGSSTITYSLTNICGTTTANVSVVINSPDTIMAIPPSNGTVSPSGPVTVNGGNQTFTFTPNAGFHITDVSIDGVSHGAISSYTFTSVSANHTITVSFAPDCTAPSITVCPGNVTANNTTGTCGATVTYTAATAGGTSPAITYSQNSGTVFPVGITTVTVNATNTCGAATCSFNVTVNDNQAPAITAPANVTMTGYCAATAVTLGTPATSDNCGVANVTNDAPASFTVGTTTVHWMVTDIHGNTATATQSVTVVPAAITAAATVTNVTCNGLSNGSITASATGGATPYTYSWANDATTASLSSLPAGTYSVTVTDAHGCSATGSYSVTQPAALSVSAATVNVNCNGGNTGSITTTVTGGATPYTYLWSNAATTATLTNKTAATYSVTVTDAHTCTATGAYTITQPAAPLTITGTVTNETCNGGSNGSITTTVTGGTSSYTYLWNTGVTTSGVSAKTAGTYSVTVTDAHSCTAVNAFTITQPAAFTVSGTVTNVSCNGSANGSIATSVSGGSSPYTYAWNTGITTSGITAKAAGTYSVTVTDAHTCTATGAFTITQPAAVTSTITGDSSVLAGITNTFTAPAGMSSYSWSVSGSGASISGSASTSSASILSPCSAASYTVSVTVAQGSCSSTSHRTITVLESATITVYGALYATSTGHYPTVTKTPLPCNLKVYDRHICGPQDGIQSHYSSVWNGTTGQITQCAVSAPVSVNYGGGPAYQYTVTVPANGHYLVIGQSSISTSGYGGSSNCTLYTAQKGGDYDCVDGSDHTNDYPLTPCSDPETVYHCALQDNTGRCQEGCIQQEIGSLLLIVSPTYIVFDDSVENVPVIYESVIGDWSASVTATPPEGFYAIPADSLSTSVTDSNMNAVQFYIADTGSVWTNTELKHTLFHKGATRTVYSHPKMVNNRINKLTALTVEPNPAKDQVRIVFPRFEGKATVRIYNMLGQKMMEQKVSIIDGTSVSMDISKLVPGTYLVSAENGSSKATSRLLVQ